MTEIILDLPKSLRSELKTPLGPIYTDTQELLADASGPLIAVGDVVTHHLIRAGETPAVALVDDRTERTDVDDEIAATITAHDGFDRSVSVRNPQATLSAELLEALVSALDAEGATLIEVDGEEDLAALPAVVLAPVGSSVVYGQPGEGMVLGTVTEDRQRAMRDLLSRMDGDEQRLWTILDG